MTQWLDRSDWGARAREHHPGQLEAGEVRGLAFHWPAMSSRLGKAAIAGALRNWQAYHMDGHGWSDIGYQVAVDQWGRIWQLRGLGNRSAANGNYAANSAYGAVLLILAPGEQPTAAMLAAARAVVAEHRRRFPRSSRLRGHGAVRVAYGLGWTQCPGPVVRRLLKAGAFNPTQEDDDMPTPQEFARAILDEETVTIRDGNGDHKRVTIRNAINRAANGPYVSRRQRRRLGAWLKRNVGGAA